MNREIKFRCWHKDEKRMSLPFTFGDLYGYEGEINAVVLSHPYVSTSQKFNIAQHNGGSLAYPQFEIEEGINKDLIFLQFTGLHDKNGKEIYEGDVVRSDDGVFYKVVYEDTRACFYFEETGLPHRQNSFGDLKEFIEVIGNIYEHSHLLKENENQ